jgi:hypothetical protein
LQKLRNYRIRLAVVCPPGSVQLSRRFAGLLAEESRERHFGVFETRGAAIEWLARSSVQAGSSSLSGRSWPPGM